VVFKNYEGRTFTYPLTATPVVDSGGISAKPVKLHEELHG
jgi:hypothetical protein